MTKEKGIIYFICFVLVVAAWYLLSFYAQTFDGTAGLAFIPISIVLFVLGGVFVGLSVVNFIFSIFKK